MSTRLTRYLTALADCLATATATDAAGAPLDLSAAIERAVDMLRQAHGGGSKILFIGNGGSAGISSHLAIDYTKNGGFRAWCFNDGAALTCYGNDLGFDQVFAAPLRTHANAGDLLIAISSSGRSSDILNAVATAREKSCAVLTLSGFSADNPLRRLGDLNLYVASAEYGFVEIAHLALCHSVLDLAMGWGGETSVASKVAGMK